MNFREKNIKAWGKGYIESKEEIKSYCMVNGIEQAYMQALDIIDEYETNNSIKEDQYKSGRYLSWLIFERNFRYCLNRIGADGSMEDVAKILMPGQGKL